MSNKKNFARPKKKVVQLVSGIGLFIIKASSILAVPQTIILPGYTNPILNPAYVVQSAYTVPLVNYADAAHVLTPALVSGYETYNIDIRQQAVAILPPSLPLLPNLKTNVFVYGDPAKPATFSFPGPSIVENSTTPSLNASGLGNPVKINFTNTLPGVTQHLLPIDNTVPGAEATLPKLRHVSHLHGLKEASQDSDGHPNAWISPTGITSTMTGMVRYSSPFTDGNNQESTMLWYHDHTMGITRLNVYAGLAGAYILRDDNEINKTTTGITAKQLPSAPYEIPLVLQDRNFYPAGALAYPDQGIPPEFFGNVMLVNGTAWPFLGVERRHYRFRILNGSNARFYTLGLQDLRPISNPPVGYNPTFYSFQVIGNEGGFLNTIKTVNQLTIAPGERYDVIIDFSLPSMAGKSIYLTNTAASPFPNGALVVPETDGQLMRFEVALPLNTAIADASTTTSLRQSAAPNLIPTKNINKANLDANPRQLVLAENKETTGQLRIFPSLGTVANGMSGFMDLPTETPEAGTVETWEIYNTTPDAHPIHLHGGHFQVIDRRTFNYTVLANKALNITGYGAVRLPIEYEQTRKDTVIAYPGATPAIAGASPDPTPRVGEVTRVRVKFEQPGHYVWHCHILEHEDFDMMRPLHVQDNKSFLDMLLTVN